MKTTPFPTLAAALVAAGLIVAPALAAQERAVAAAATPDASQVERRLQSVRTLVESSSAARQIESSGDARAASQRAEARQLLRLAEEAHEARDDRSAAALLDDAARQMFAGAKLASGEAARGVSQEQQIAARIEAAQALAAAQKRITSEKSAPGAADTGRQIDRLLAQAREDLAAHRYDAAKASAQQGYLLAKASIGSMRGGDTLVRELRFASKAEEYHYEIDRFDTHRMLVDLLATKPGVDDAPARAAVGRATDLRRQAESAAAAGDHARAVTMLEDATRELVRAIRAAGVFIPG